MSNKKQKLTRRGALGLMIGGGGLAATETLGFTNLAAGRLSDVAVAGDEDAFLRLIGVGTEENPEPYGSPHTVKITNQLGETVDIEVTSEDFDIEPTGKQEVEEGNPEDSEGHETWFVSIPDGETNTDGIDEKTGTISIEASSDSVSVSADREIKLKYPITEQLNVWYDAADGSTVRREDNPALHNQNVDEWWARDESTDDINLIPENSDRPRYRLNGEAILPSIHFNNSGDRFTSVGPTNLADVTERQATLFFVVDRKASTTGKIIEFEEDSDNYIRYTYKSGNDEFAVGLKADDGSTDSLTINGPDTTNPFLIAVRFSQGGDDDEIEVDLRFNTTTTRTTRSTSTLQFDDTVSLPDVDIDLSNSSFQGLYGEILAFAEQSESDFQAMRDEYLAPKWGLKEP